MSLGHLGDRAASRKTRASASSRACGRRRARRREHTAGVPGARAAVGGHPTRADAVHSRDGRGCRLRAQNDVRHRARDDRQRGRCGRRGPTARESAPVARAGRSGGGSGAPLRARHHERQPVVDPARGGRPVTCGSALIAIGARGARWARCRTSRRTPLRRPRSLPRGARRCSTPFSPPPRGTSRSSSRRLWAICQRAPRSGRRSSGRAACASNIAALVLANLALAPSRGTRRRGGRDGAVLASLLGSHDEGAVEMGAHALGVLAGVLARRRGSNGCERPRGDAGAGCSRVQHEVARGALPPHRPSVAMSMLSADSFF